MIAMDKPRAPLYKILFFIYFEFTNVVLLGFSIGLLFPYHVIKMIDNDNRTFYIGTMGIISGTTLMFSGLAAGTISDKMKTWVGKRKPFIFFAITGSCVTLTIRCLLPIDDASIPIIVLYSVVYICGTVSLGCMMSVFRSFLVEMIHPSQMHMASTLFGLSTILGIMVGSSLFSLFFTLIPTWASLIIVLGLLLPAGTIILLFFKEPDRNYSKGLVSFSSKESKPLDELRYEATDALLNNETPIPVDQISRIQSLKQFLINDNPLLQRNFLGVFLSRFFFQWSAFSFTSYMLLFFNDSFQHNFSILFWKDVVTNAVQANGVYGFCSSTISICSGVLFGTMSPSLGRKTVAIMASIMFICGATSAVFIRSFSAIIVSGALMGMGSGAYHSVDFALVNESIADKSNIARDLAVWQLSLSLPQLFSSTVSGLIVGTCDKLFFAGKISRPHMGYAGMFAFSALLQLASILSLSIVRPVKKLNTSQLRVNT